MTVHQFPGVPVAVPGVCCELTHTSRAINSVPIPEAFMRLTLSHDSFPTVRFTSGERYPRYL